jgi:hypothetical protein
LAKVQRRESGHSFFKSKNKRGAISHRSLSSIDGLNIPAENGLNKSKDVDYFF